MNIQRILFAATLLLVVVSCNVGKKYQQPELELPSTFNQDSTGDTTSIASISWKEYFTDSTLQHLIDTGIVYNHDLLIAVNRMDQARRRLSQSKLLQLPSADFQVTAQYNRPSKNSLNGISANSFLGKSHIENYLAVFSLSWEADIWGKIRGQQVAAAADYIQTEEATKAVQTQLVSDIAQGYFNLLMLDEQLEIARKNLLLSDSFVLATRMLKDAGMVSQLAIEQAESQRQSTALLVPQIEEDIALQENALQQLTGNLPGILRRERPQGLMMSENAGAGVPVSLVSRRPDVRAAEMALVAANARVGVSKANMYPALTLTAGGGLETFTASNWFNIPGSLFGLAAGSVLQPVFRRNELKTEFEVAKLEREQAVIRFRQQVLIAVKEVTNALVSIDKLEEQKRIAVAQVDTLETASRNARLLFGSDLATYLEVITAQGNSLQAQLNLAMIERAQLGAKVELYRALGGGW